MPYGQYGFMVRPPSSADWYGGCIIVCEREQHCSFALIISHTDLGDSARRELLQGRARRTRLAQGFVVDGRRRECTEYMHYS